MHSYPERPPPIDPGCPAFEDRLALYADGALEGGDEAAVAAHLRTCARCGREVAAYATVIARLRDDAEARSPRADAAIFRAMQFEIDAAIGRLPRSTSSWRRPAARWAGGLTIAAALSLLLAGPVRTLVSGGAIEATAAVDPRALIGPATEAAASDRAFVDDLAASEDDPANTLDELDDIDLDALGTALDDEAEGGQGA